SHVSLSLFPTRRSSDLENVCVNPDQMIVAQIRWLNVEDLFNLPGQCINGPARSKPDIYLILFFLRHAADLQHLTFVLLAKDFNRVSDLNLLVLFFSLLYFVDVS